MMKRLSILALAATAFAWGAPAPAGAVDLGIVAFQMSAETHARVANAAKAAAEEKGWTVTVLNSAGAMADHAAQLENLTQRGVDAIIVAMGKPVETDGQLAAAKEAGIPVISVMSGGSPQTLFDIQVNEYQVGAEAALYLLGLIDYQGDILQQRFEGNVGTRIRGKVLDTVLSENPQVETIGSHAMARTKSWREDVRSGMEALLLQNQGNVDGIWASFDGQAFIIDDLLTAQGASKGNPALVSIDGGPEAYDRIKDPDSMLLATVAIPFEAMGEAAVDMVNAIVVEGKDPDTLVAGPYLLMDATLVDASNVDDFIQ